MALSIEITDPADGSILPDAYARVTAASIDVLNQRAAATVCIYKDAAARLADRSPIAYRHLTWDAEGAPSRTEPTGEMIPARPSFEQAFGGAAKSNVNVFSRAYIVLKTYDIEFSNATDV